MENKNLFYLSKDLNKTSFNSNIFFKWLVFLQRFYNQRVFKLIPELLDNQNPFLGKRKGLLINC
jgi:hypothetical protein